MSQGQFERALGLDSLFFVVQRDDDAVFDAAARSEDLPLQRSCMTMLTDTLPVMIVIGGWQAAAHFARKRLERGHVDDSGARDSLVEDVRRQRVDGRHFARRQIPHDDGLIEDERIEAACARSRVCVLSARGTAFAAGGTSPLRRPTALAVAPPTLRTALAAAKTAHPRCWRGRGAACLCAGSYRP